MVSRNITVEISLVTVVLIFFLLVVLNEVLKGDDPSINHKLDSLVSFGRVSNSSSREVIPFKVNKQDAVVCPLLQPGLKTDWSKEKAAYNSKDEIFLDWNIDSYLFTYMHYKALESAFVSYPKASFHLIIVGPNAANYYKINDLISKHQFQKYKKRGYLMTPVVVGSMKALSSSASSLTMYYWGLQESQYCSTKGKKTVHDVKTAPYHVWMYVRLQKLLASSGGLSFDFSWLHLKPLDEKIKFGFKMSTVCTIQDNPTRAQRHTKREEVHLTPSTSLLNPYNATSFNSEHQSYKDCYTSSFIVLRKRYMSDKVYEHILLCMLTKYDEHASDGSGPLLDCFQKDVLTGGALCLQIALTDCFAQYTQNQLASESDTGRSNVNLMQSAEPPAASDKRVLSSSSLITFKWQSEAASLWQLHPLYSYSAEARELVVNCFVRRVLLFFKTFSSSYPDLMTSCPTTYDTDTIIRNKNNEDTISNLKGDDDSFSISAMWLGRNMGHPYQDRKASENRSIFSQSNEEGNINIPFTKWESEKTSLDWFVPEKNTLLGRLVNAIESHMCRPIGGLPIADMHKGTCSPYTSSVLTAMEATAGAAQWSIPPSHNPVDNSRTAKSCSINFVIPGFMKCASSFLFEALTNHPQVLRALKGVNFKETGCYLPPIKGIVRVDSPNHRMNCFPFIEKHESNYIYGDATVTYSSNFDVPYYLQKDNPQIKSIFVVRNPISRLESHFRFSLGLMKSLGYETVDKAIAYALRSDSSLHTLRKEAELLLMDLNEDKSSKDMLLKGNILLSDCLSNLWILYFQFDHCAHLFQEESKNNSSNIDALHEKNKISHYISRFFIPHSSSGAKNRHDRVTSLIVRTSIYFPVIAHWCKVLKTDNVIVVENKHLSLSSNSKSNSKKSGSDVVVLELKRIHRFLNIAEHANSVPGQVVHNTGKGANVSTCSASSRTVLKEFFDPFNELLRRLVYHAKIANYDINYNV